MSFWPLPTTLLERLRKLAAEAPMVELGAGRGDLAHRLRDAGVDLTLLDRAIPSKQVEMRSRWLQADVLHLPFRGESLSATILANTWRHIRAADRPALSIEIHEVLRPGACVVVLEDHPVARSRDEDNYRRSLDLLARVDPLRGTVVRAAACDEIFASTFGAPLAAGEADNRLKVENPMAPVDWMSSRRALGRDLREEIDRLRQEISRCGMHYGRYWYRVYGKAER